MGVEVKSGGEGVIVADRGCNDGCCCNGRNSGWGSGWGAVGVAKDVAGVGREILNNRFTTERGLCDLGYKTNSDIRDSRDQMGAGFNRVMDRLCNMEHQQSDCCCETKGLIKEVKSDLALQLERCCCDLKKGQQEIKCLIENTAKDQEIARLNRVVDAQRDQNIINQVVAALKTTGGTTTA
jgi:hypothetical protein